MEIDCVKNEEHDKQEKEYNKDNKTITIIEKSSKRSLVHISTTNKLERDKFVEQ